MQTFVCCLASSLILRFVGVSQALQYTSAKTSFPKTLPNQARDQLEQHAGKIIVNHFVCREHICHSTATSRCCTLLSTNMG